MEKVYDDEYHLHLGYYEDNCDYESVTFKRKTGKSLKIRMILLI